MAIQILSFTTNPYSIVSSIELGSIEIRYVFHKIVKTKFIFGKKHEIETNIHVLLEITSPNHYNM